MLQKYPALAYRTCKELPIEEHMSHMGLGLSTETLELILTEGPENTKEELGDIMWYIGSLAYVMNIEIDERDVPEDIDETDAFNILTTYVEKLVSAIKKSVIYKKTFTLNEFKTMISDVVYGVKCMCYVYDLDLNHILIENVEKLEKRYPEKYSDVAAIRRADKIS